MLVLTRKLNEQIRIGDNVIVTVLRVKGNTVRIGIEAPRDVRVVRGELPVFDSGEEGDPPAEPEGATGEMPIGEELEEAPLAAYRASARKAINSLRRASRGVLTTA